jgi:rhamnosyltransferase
LYEPENNNYFELIKVLKNFSTVVIISNDNHDRQIENVENFLFANIGTGGAYNFVINNFEFDYLWVWDQDTLINYDQVQKFLGHIPFFENDSQYCSLSFSDKYNCVDYTVGEYDIIKYGKASGTLFKSAALREVGNFMEDLFLDYVDYEYFLRLRFFNFIPLQIRELECESHILGDAQDTLFFGRKHVSSPKRWHLQKINTLKLNKLMYIPLSLKLKLSVRILFLFVYALIFKDRKKRLVYLLK